VRQAFATACRKNGNNWTRNATPFDQIFMKNFLNMFRVNGKSYAITFALVSTLFFLWGFCNGMIDVL
jgi:hypothetical protein